MQEASRFLASFEVVLEDEVKAMASHKVEYMNSQIQRLILASKIASGVWPPQFGNSPSLPLLFFLFCDIVNDPPIMLKFFDHPNSP